MSLEATQVHQVIANTFYGNKCIINFFWGKITITLREKKRRFYKWTLYFFSFFFGLVMCHEPQNEALWPLKKCMLYTLCTLILFNPLHLTIGSSLTLIQNELWVPKCCHAHSKIYFLIFTIFKRCHKDFNLMHIYHVCYM